MENTVVRDGARSAYAHGVSPLRLSFKGMINYSYVVFDLSSREAAIVDPAWDLEKILAELKVLDVKLTKIFLTHSHFDHVNLVGPLVRIFDAQVVISWEEMDYYDFSCGNIHPVHHLDEVEIGRTPVTCLLTPGHTAGGMCYLLSDSIFTGDTIFIEGCGSCDPDGGGAEELFDSIQMVKRTVAHRTRVFPGHSYGKAPGRELDLLMRENIYLQIDQKDTFIDFRMRKGQKGLFDFK